MNMIYLLAGEGLTDLNLCTGSMAMVWTIFGYIILGIEIVVPLILIIYGMIDMAKAVMQDDEKKIKTAQQLLIKKIITAVICFLVIAITKIVVNLVTNSDWESCAKCAFKPIQDGCGIKVSDINTK